MPKSFIILILIVTMSHSSDTTSYSLDSVSDPVKKQIEKYKKPFLNDLKNAGINPDEVSDEKRKKSII